MSAIWGPYNGSMAVRHYFLVTPLAYTGAADGFTYQSDEALVRGSLVHVPVGRRQLIGVVRGAVDPPEFNTKPITDRLELPGLSPDLMNLAEWMAAYYASSLASVFQTMLPSGLDKQRRASKETIAPVAKSLPDSPLTPEQATALDRIQAGSRATTLLQGVTGSGKTRVYLELAARALSANRSVIILVPEITLTPQVVGQFEEAFGPAVLASHSKLTEAQRHHIWTEATTAAHHQSARLIVGPRSCLFMPLHELGLIIIDEAHETTYKQEQHPKYHAIPTAAKRASLAGAKLILGSATPALGELFLAQQERIEHLFLTQRYNKIPLPEAKILDMREKESFRLSKFITQELVDAVATTTAAGRQSLLYLNRRGSASSQVCSDCGFVTACPNCALPLTFHADLMRLICHHCNFQRPSPALCPQCNGADLKLLGGGTKRIEAEILRLFPEARVARLDRDSATLSHIKAVYRGLKKGEIDIVIGTQMIAKGLDLPAIDTVGVVNADTMLYVPDFTAAERTFQLLSQVSGRAGRGDRPGQIFIQTYAPHHPAIVAAATGAFDRFAEAELLERQALSYPPYVYLLQLTVATASRELSATAGADLARKLRAQPDIAVIGPAPAFLEQQNRRFVWTITIKSKRRSLLVNIATHLPDDRWTANLDPVNLL
jgi:primosomal protein N' (replication factor Y)